MYPHFPPFLPLSSILSPNLLFGYIFAPPPGEGVKQKNIHPCMNVALDVFGNKSGSYLSYLMLLNFLKIRHLSPYHFYILKLT